MTEDPTPLLGLVLADDAEFFERLRGVEKSDCTRCKTAARVTAGPVLADSDGIARQEMRCACDWTWSVVVDGGAS